MSFLDKMKNKIKGKSIDEEINSVLRDEDSYSKRVLDANQRPQKNDAEPRQLGKLPSAQNAMSAPPMQSTDRAYENANTSPLLKSRQGIPQQQAEPNLPNEEEFMRQRFGADQIEDKDVPPPPDLIGLPGANVEKENMLSRHETSLTHRQDLGSDDVLNELLLSMKDLRAQNNHIIDLLRNMQDRLSKH